MKQILDSRLILNVFAALLLAGCTINPNKTQDIAVYDFGLPAPGIDTNGRWAEVRLEVKAPAWAGSLGVDYRLSYEEPLKRREYAGSRWAGVPNVLLARLLQQQLGTVGGSENVASNCQLLIDLQEFSQVFVTPQESRGVLHATARLVDARRQLLAEQHMRVETPASSADARGGVKALLASSTEFGHQLSVWLEGLRRDNRRNGCWSEQSSRTR